MIDIRLVQVEEVEIVKSFIEQVITDDFGYEINPDWHWDVINLADTYMKNNGLIYGAWIEGEIVGTIACRLYDRDYSMFRERYRKENTVGIWRHYVKKGTRGKGVGTLLLNKLELEVKKLGCEYVYLHTQKTIPHSLEYWLAKGYRITHDTDDEYQTVHLEKELGEE